MSKFILTLCLTILTATGAHAGQPRQEGPAMEFTTSKHDFGRIQYKGEPGTAEFSFVNTGNAPLVILRTQVSCTCLTTEFPKKPVAPGQSGIIRVTYTPKKDLGAFNHTVKVVTNTPEKTHTLFIDVEVVRK